MLVLPLLLALAGLSCAAVICVVVAGPIGSVWACLLGLIVLLGVVLPPVLVRCVEVRLAGTGIVEVGTPSETGLVVRGRCPLAVPAVMLRVDGWSSSLEPVRFGRQRQLVLLEGLSRGIYQMSDIRVECGFPFGLIWATRAAAGEERIVVRPRQFAVPALVDRVVRVSAGPGPSSADSGDFGGLRAYQRGDTPRQIAWAATARLGQLVSRRRTIMADCDWHLLLDEAAFALNGDRPAYELAVSALASFATACVAAGQPATVYAGGRSVAVHDENTLATLLDELAALPSRPCGGRRSSSLQRPGPAFLLTGADAPRQLPCAVVFAFASIGSDADTIGSEQAFIERLTTRGLALGATRVCSA